MKYLSTKLFLNEEISKEKFTHIISSVHHIPLDTYDFSNKTVSITKYHTSILHYAKKNIISFLIKNDEELNSWYYEYNYQYDSHVLYLNIKRSSMIPKETEPMVNLIKYLNEHHYIKPYSFYSYNTPTCIDQTNYLEFVNDIKNKEMLLPIIYFDYNFIQEYKNIKNHLINLLEGFAFVVYSEDVKIDNHIQKSFNLSTGSYIFYSDFDIHKIPETHCKFNEMVSMIFSRIKDYVTRLDYDLTLAKLNFEYLKDMNENDKTNEENILIDFDEEMNSIDYAINDLMDKISKLENSITVLEAQNEHYESITKQQEYYPILTLGETEKEFYDGEQKDMLLYLLEQEIKANPSDTNYEANLIKQILALNEKNGTRDMYLDNIFKILVSAKNFSAPVIENLKKYGIMMNKEGKKHHDCHFFDDSRYQLTIASTPSDMNACREIFRQMKQYYF